MNRRMKKRRRSRSQWASVIDWTPRIQIDTSPDANSHGKRRQDGDNERTNNREEMKWVKKWWNVQLSSQAAVPRGRKSKTTAQQTNEEASEHQGHETGRPSSEERRRGTEQPIRATSCQDHERPCSEMRCTSKSVFISWETQFVPETTIRQVVDLMHAPVKELAWFVQK